jgi:hypothetical protein
MFVVCLKMLFFKCMVLSNEGMNVSFGKMWKNEVIVRFNALKY